MSHLKNCRALITEMGGVPFNDFRLPCTCGEDSPDALVRMAKNWLDEYIKNTGIEANVCAYDLLTFLRARQTKDAAVLRHKETGVANGTNLD